MVKPGAVSSHTRISPTREPLSIPARGGFRVELAHCSSVLLKSRGRGGGKMMDLVIVSSANGIFKTLSFLESRLHHTGETWLSLAGVHWSAPLSIIHAKPRPLSDINQ